MKKLLVLLFLLLVSSPKTKAQNNFAWELTDSVPKTAIQIYNETKLFIAETWKSAKAVIQLDDKDAGIILIKGTILKQNQFMMGEYDYYYDYTVTFKMKENRFKVILDNVNCSSTYFSGHGTISKIQPFDGENCPETGTFSNPGIPRKKAIKMMAQLKNDMQQIVDAYIISIKFSKPKDDW